MIRFILRRLFTLIPSVFGISLVTFVLINLSLGTRSGDMRGRNQLASGGETTDEFSRSLALHLPLFINLSIQDVRSRAETDIRQLRDPRTRKKAVRSLSGTGGAIIPWLLPVLPTLTGETREAALDALEPIGARIGHRDELSTTSDRAAFWARFHSIYGSDFTSVRASRLIRRYARRDDELALHEIRRLDTFALPELMSALDDDLTDEGRMRVVDLLCELTGRRDFYSPGALEETRQHTLERWGEWWKQRYDLYTPFEGIRRITGMVTETRYFHWLSRVVTFDFGVSVRDGQPIRAKIAQRLPVTLLLSGVALLLAYLVAIPLGVLTAMKRGSAFDRRASFVLFIVYSIPAFWVAVLALRYFSTTGVFPWFPSSGLSSPDVTANSSTGARFFDAVRHLILPVLCLSFVSMAMLARFQRVGMVHIAEADFMRTARAKGLSERQVILRHGLRNGVIPLITLMGVQLPYMVSGSVIIEWIFNIPGMGLETFAAIRSADYFWLLAVVTVTASLTVIGVMLSDVIYAIVDPRMVPGRGTLRRA